MITKQDALTANTFYFRISNPHNNHHGEVRKCRRNGATKTWKTRPDEFRVPVKYGLYECFYITQDNADEFYLASPG